MSRFENGEKNIQLSSAIAILEAMGMTEKAALTFPDKSERYISEREIIIFEGRSDEGLVQCAISAEALMDHFEAESMRRRNLETAFKQNRSVIERAAARKFEHRQLKSDGSLLLRSRDI